MRVLICEDSRTYAVALRRMLEYDSDITVAAVCGSAEETIAVLPRVRPDLVTMDMVLPGMDGLRAVEEIMSSQPLPILVLLAAAASRGEDAAAALAAGALDILAKDDLDVRDLAGPGGIAFRQRAKVLSRAHVIRHPRARLRQPGTLPQRMAHQVSVVGVCASTGGPQALVRVLEQLPADYPIPVLVVQHVGAGFSSGLARWLDEAIPPPVAIAADNSRAAPGVWIAPEGAHLTMTRAGRLHLDRRTVAGHHRPAGDVLFSSIAATAGSTGVAIVLSGMGSDGADGTVAVRRCGGLAIAQDKVSSAIHGMPKAAIDRGVDLVLSPAEIACFLLRLVPEPLAGAR